MRHAVTLGVGPARFRIGSDWRAPVKALRELYRDYPTGEGVPDFTVRLEATRPWRRWLRPQVAIAGDLTLPEAVPLPLDHALLAAEMAMNLQMALGWRRHLLLHAAVVEKDGRAAILTGESGAGKSTLAALMMAAGWRLLGDEFALVDPASGHCVPFPRPVSLKNESVAAVAAALSEARFGPWLRGTPKGDLRHLVPDADSLARMGEAARPVVLVLPRYGEAADRRAVPASEAFVRLTQASTNYVALGERGFACLTRLVNEVPAVALDYPDGAAGVAAVEAVWAAA